MEKTLVETAQLLFQQTTYWKITKNCATEKALFIEFSGKFLHI